MGFMIYDKTVGIS